MRMWLDDQSAYSLNEVAINWNAPLVFLLAAANALAQTTLTPVTALMMPTINFASSLHLSAQSPGNYNITNGGTLTLNGVTLNAVFGAEKNGVAQSVAAVGVASNGCSIEILATR